MAESKINSVGIVKTQTLRVVEQDNPLELECGRKLGPIDVAYETYGTLNQAGDNVILICHALSGNAHVAGLNKPDDSKPGWWDIMVGPGKGIDTNKYFVICSNFLGGCSGTTGPSSINPQTQKPYGRDFPIITVADMVNVQKLLLDKLSIRKVLAVIGGSIGGMQVLQWAIAYPDIIRAAIPIATTAHLNAQSIAFDAVGRNAILGDPNFADGQYKDRQKGPDRGLSIARMIGHITYLSEESMRKKFGRKLRKAEDYSYDFNSEFAVETYLDYQGQLFIERFDANSYLYITKAADYFDLEKDNNTLQEAFKPVKSRFLVISFEGDWLFPPSQSEEIVSALAASHKDVSYCNIASPYGHDAFLLEPEALGSLLSGFIDSTHRPNNRPAPSNGKKKLSSIEQAKRLRLDYDLIDSLIEPGRSVLDVGCGDGELLAKLIENKNVCGKGIERDQDHIISCIGAGVPVIHRDIEYGLSYYADKSFDVVTLSQTLQTLKNPEAVLIELLRIGKKVIVSFPNFANWQCRLQLLLKGMAPTTRQLPFPWYTSPNIHCISINDFDRFCSKLGVKIEKKMALTETRGRQVKFAPNLFAEDAIYVISKD